MDYKKYRVSGKGKIRLKDFDPNDASEFDGKKKAGEEALIKVNQDIEALQEQMFAEGKRRLIVLRGLVAMEFVPPDAASARMGDARLPGAGN